VYRAELLWHDDERAAFEIDCSSGTYVRSLVTDLGDAYCEELERTAIGPFRLEEVASSEDPVHIVPLRDALAFMPERLLSADEARAVSYGRPIPAHGDVTGHVRMTREGELLAIGEAGEGPPSQADEVRPVVVFAPA
jgi:tRNA pseudouridine55 synthase